MKSKWMIVILVASLALNLALVGYLAGRSSSGKLYSNPDPTRGFPRWAMTLPDERREALRPTFFQAEKRRQMRALRAQHETLHSAVASDPFDAAALAQALADMRTAMAELELANHAAFQEFVSQLTPEERLELAAHLERPRYRRRPPPEPRER